VRASVLRAIAFSAAVMSLTTCGRSSGGSPTTPTNPGGGTSTGNFSFLAGTWIGTWTDQRYGVSGTLQATFAVSGSTVTATGTIGLASLGIGNQSGTGTGTVTGSTLNFTFSANAVGTGSGSVTNGAGSGTGTVTGVLNLGGFTYAGTANANTISGTFQFTSPTGGNGVASLTKQS
jgi:hypothetical protein